MMANLRVCNWYQFDTCRIINFITNLMDNFLRVEKLIVKKMLPFDRKISYFFQDKTDDNYQDNFKVIIQVVADDNFV